MQRFLLLLCFLTAACAARPTAEINPRVEATPPPPTLLNVQGQPADGTLTVDGETLDLDTNLNLKPGEHLLSLSRKGFTPSQVTVQLQEGERQVLKLSLEGLPHKVSVTSYPKKATITLLRGGDVLAEGPAPLEAELSAGPILLRSSLKGFAESERSLFIDQETQLKECMDVEGQLLDCQWEAPSKRSPKAVIFSPNGSELWTAQLNGTPSVRVYSVTNGVELGSITLGKHGAVELEFSADGTKLYATQMDTATVWEIDHEAREVLRTFQTKSRWTKVVERSADGTKLYTSNWLGADVSEIDIASGKMLRRIRTVKTPRGLWAHPDGKSLYVAGFGDGRLDRIELETGKRHKVFQGAVLRHLEADEERGRLYISDMRSSAIYVMDIETEKVTKLTATEKHPNTIALSPDGQLLFVSCRGRNGKNWMAKGPEWGSLMIFDALTGEVLDVIVAGNQPTALAVSPDGKLMAFSDILDNRIRVYSIPSFEELKAGGGGLRDVYKKRLRK